MSKDVVVSKVFRVFISSTFSDFEEERNYLQKHVFPELEELLRILEGGILEIMVRDRGVGIADVEQARAPMFTTGGAGRSGMGFTIMESFMTHLRVVSTPGRGTTVYLRRKIVRRGGA